MTAYTDLLAQAESEKRFLCQLDFWDIDDEAIVSEYFSSHGFTSAPADTPANQHYEPRLIRPLDYERTLSLQNLFCGVAFPVGGSIVLDNTDGGLDHFRRRVSGGYRVRVWLGGPSFALSDYGLIADAVAEGHDFDARNLTITLRNPNHVFDKEIQTNRYAGSGNAEGNADLANRLKCRCWGLRRNVEPVYLGVSSGGKHLFAVNDGAIVGILNLKNYALELDFVAGTPGSAEWSYDAATGIITLGGAYEGPIRADVIGKRYLSTTSTTSWALGTGSKTFVVASATGLAVGMTVRVMRTSALHSTHGDGAITAIAGTSITVNVTQTTGSGTHTDWTMAPWGTVGGIIKDIATIVGVSSFDATSFSDLDTAQPATAGLWLQQGGNALQVLDEFAKQGGAFAGFDLNRNFEVGRIAAPASSQATYTESQIERDSFDSIDIPPPHHTIVCRYQQNMGVLSAGDIVGAVTEAERVFQLNEWRRSTPFEDSDIETAYPQSVPLEVDTCFDTAAVANAEATRLGALFGVTREMFALSLKVQPLVRDLGESVTLQYTGRFDLGAGKLMRIVGAHHEMDPRQIKSTLTVWG